MKQFNKGDRVCMSSYAKENGVRQNKRNGAIAVQTGTIIGKARLSYAVIVLFDGHKTNCTLSTKYLDLIIENK